MIITKKYILFAFLLAIIIYISITSALSATIMVDAELTNETKFYDADAINDEFDIQENSDFIKLINNQRYYPRNVPINILISLDSQNAILDYTYTTTTINVLSSYISDYYQLEFNLEFILGENEYKLNMVIETEDNIVNACLYSIVNDYGIFISILSEEDAFLNYTNYLQENEIATSYECADLLMEYYSDGIIEESYTISTNNSRSSISQNNQNSFSSSDLYDSTSNSTQSSSSSKTTYIEGTLKWKDDYNVVHPLRRIAVEIYDYDGICDDFIGNTYTDHEGYYSYSFNNKDALLDFENGGYDLYIRVCAGDYNIEVVDSNVDLRYYQTGRQSHMDVATGSTTIINLTFDMSTYLGQSFQISQAVITARDFAWHMSDTLPSNVKVLYPYGGGDCLYSSGNKTIYIADVSLNDPSNAVILSAYESWDVIMHEYGHHIQHEMDITDSPGGTHYPRVNLLNATNLNLNKSAAIRLAWGESWPTIFGIIAQKYYSSYLTNIYTTCDTYYTSYNGLNYDIEVKDFPNSNGEASEYAIMSVLWDLYDTTTETNDTISMSYQEWWDVTTESTATTFSEFIAHFYQAYPDYIDDIGLNLTYYKIAASNLTSSIPVNQWDLTPPVFSWTPEGGAINYPNNSFNLTVQTDLFGLLGTGTKNSINNIQLSNFTWEILLAFPDEYAILTVATYQTDAPSTGPYYSEFKFFLKQTYKTSVSNNAVTITGTYRQLSGYVSIPSTLDGLPVIAIADGAFSGSYDLENISFPSSIATIGANAFKNCISLATVSLSSTSITRIEENTFMGCPITNLSLPNTLTYIGKKAFYNSAFTRLKLFSTVTHIMEDAFLNNNKLTIYTQYQSKPSGWNSSWNSSNRPVFWGCSFSSVNGYVTSFLKTTGNQYNFDATSDAYLNPTRSLYSFDGWYSTSDFSGSKYTDLHNAPNGTYYVKWSSSCVAEGTLVTLADGTTKAVEELNSYDLLLVWNVFTGSFDFAPIIFNESEDYEEYTIIHLYFSDGTEIKVINEHGFWDVDLNEYIFIREDADQYIGHYFNKHYFDSNNELNWTTVQLIDVELYTEVTTAWSPVTYSYLCYYVNGLLSMPGNTTGLINIFEVDSVTMQIDQVSFTNDINEYGIFTYKEFAEMIAIPEEIFDAFSVQYLKISIGKGLIDWETIILLIERYSVFLTI
ncbi:MAG: leucine-rich repeat protein [Christensenellaceae bacterium]|jgi:hypothetical protein|nr:leucine-rich repeat protein [Christensenellaceae bacterium]